MIDLKRKTFDLIRLCVQATILNEKTKRNNDSIGKSFFIILELRDLAEEQKKRRPTFIETSMAEWADCRLELLEMVKTGKRVIAQCPDLGLYNNRHLRTVVIMQYQNSIVFF